MKEFFDYPFFKGYQVNEDGIVRSCDKEVKCKNGTRIHKGKVLKPTFDGGGYVQYCLSENSKGKWVKAHKLVWETFNGKIEEGLEIDHIDGNKTNNSLSNLRVVTHHENLMNPITISRRKALWKDKDWRENWSRKNRNRPKFSKKVAQYSQDMVLETIYPSMHEAQRNGYNRCDIKKCCNGKIEKVKGKIFRWYED